MPSERIQARYYYTSSNLSLSFSSKFVVSLSLPEDCDLLRVGVAPCYVSQIPAFPWSISIHRDSSSEMFDPLTGKE